MQKVFWKVLRKLKAVAFPAPHYPLHAQYVRAKEMLSSPGRLVDLGCGPSPHPQACVAVDKYIEPEHRSFGMGKQIDVGSIENKGIRFVNADIAAMPFSDKEFDTVFCHHVIEHVDDPITVCREVQRIAKQGVFFAPSIFAEIAFGRSYHKWLMSAKGNTLIFIEKNEDENQPFGKMITSNPFDKVLNDGFWYKKPVWIPSLRRLFRSYWYGHHPVMEVVFVWKDRFNVLVIAKDGVITQC